MMRGKFSLGLLLATAPALIGAAPVAMQPEDIVAGRRAAYFLSGAVMSEMQSATAGEGTVKNQAFAAQALARWARTLPAMFPAGSLVAGSHADARVWSQRADFEAKAKDYADAAQMLAQIAQTDDKAAFTAQLATLRTKCAACHQTYLVKPPS
ncbi:MAG TPA: cytochrome c [Allosphingosinicella sp.]|jgi:cytochrome c556|nr:cytochrome c [Allosphingosinicella sp.]